MNSDFLVDADASTAPAVTAALHPAGLGVKCYRTGREFLEGFSGGLIGSIGGCLIINVSLPDMSGLELQERDA